MGRSFYLSNVARASSGLVLSLALVAFGLNACTAADEADDSAQSGEQAVASGVNVLTSRFDNGRSGANPNEKVLKTSNVVGSSFGKIFSRPVDGQVYAQPLYASGVNGKNVVYVATEHNSIYAFDADDTRANAPPLWQKNFGPSVPSQDTGCGLLSPEIGITSTPVIDTQSKTMWFTTKTKEFGKYFHKLHAVDIETGNEKANSPSTITAQAPGDGDGTGNTVVMDPLKHMNRPGLLKVGGKIYIGFASNCDIQPYHGWILSYDATTLQQRAVHVNTPNGEEGGIWHAGVGLPADETGDVYYVSGNGTFDGQDNFGNSMVRLKDNGSSFTVKTFFTPFDSTAANNQDLDLGSTGGMLIPGTQMFVGGDKRGLFYLVNKNQMGGLSANHDNVLQRFQATTRGVYGGAAFYKKGNGGIYYLWGTGDRLKAFKFNGQTFDLPPLVNTTTLTGYPGGQLTVSSDNEVAGSAILWAIRGKRTSAGLAASVGSGTLLAFDANDITQQLWSSDNSPADALGDATKFAVPTVANGRVFVGTSSNQLVVYGLKNVGSSNDAGAPDSSTGSDAGADSSSSSTDASATLTWTQLYAQYFAAGTPGHCSGTGGCHTNLRAGFKCGTNKSDCYTGLVNAGLIDTTNPSQSTLITSDSPLSWFGGGMPLDNPTANPSAAAAVKAWVLAGAQNN